MKRLLPWMSILVLVSLVGCGMLSGGGSPTTGNPTLSPEQVQTQMVQLMTLMPTSTGGPAVAATATQSLPTIQVATETTAPLVSTNTPQPAANSTSAPVTQVATTLPTTAPTATNVVLPTSTQAPVPAFTAPPGDPRARLGNPTSTDTIDNDTNWVWPTGSDTFTSATFTGGAQVITALDPKDGWRLANPAGREFTNIYLEGTFRTNTCAGSDHYGLMVRVPILKEPEQGYLFGVTCDGRFSLRRWNGLVGEKGEMKWLVNWTASSAIAQGSNQTNRLGIFAVGSRLILYANGVLLTEVKDTLYPSGYFGVFIGQDQTSQMTIRVEEMSYWENPQP
jgi:hypothetical protein